MKKQVWRLVDGTAVECTNCMRNQNDLCTAENEVCVFLKKKIDQQKTWSDFHDAYREKNEEAGL